MTRSVFIFGKPPSLPNRLRLPNLLWQGKFHLSHWSLLVTRVTDAELRQMLQDPAFANQTARLGLLFELSIGGGNIISLKSRPVSGRTLRMQLDDYIFDYIGTTEMTN